VRLARKASSNDRREHTASLKHRIACNILDSTKADAIGKAPVIHGAGKGFDFGVGDRTKRRTSSGKHFPPVPGLRLTPLSLLGVGHSVGDFGGKGESADSREKVEHV
jgi:hypothetical protein